MRTIKDLENDYAKTAAQLGELIFKSELEIENLKMKLVMLQEEAKSIQKEKKVG